MHRARWMLVWLAASALALFWLWLNPALIGWDAQVLQGMGVETLRGTTEGRQALVGSAAYGLLPGLIALTGCRLGLSGTLPWAAMLSGALAMGAFWTLGWKVLGRCLPLMWALPLAAALAFAHPALGLIGSAPAALAAATGAACLILLSDWAASPRLRHLLPTAAAFAAAILSPVDIAGWLATLVLLWMLLALIRPGTRKRWPATFLLALLPMTYAMAVWILLNWLVLGDPGFLVRGLTTISWQGRPAGFFMDAPPTVSAAAALCVLGVWHGLRRRDGGVTLTGLCGLLAWGWSYLCLGLDLAWAVPTLRALTLMAGICTAGRIVAAWRPTFPDAARFLSVTPLLAVGIGMLSLSASDGPFSVGTCSRAQTMVTGMPKISPYAPSAVIPARRGPQPHDRDGEAMQATVGLLQDVERFVLDRKPYGRLFVIGFDGLGLLWNREFDLQSPRPVLDLYLPELRADYYGHNLFLLVRKPSGRNAIDPLLARYPDLHALGMERLLFVRDWNQWRLFEIVTAPDRPLRKRE